MAKEIYRLRYHFYKLKKLPNDFNTKIRKVLQCVRLTTQTIIGQQSVSCFALHYFNKVGLQNSYFLFFDGRWNIYGLIDGILLYLEDVSVGGEELAKGLKPIRKGKIFWIICFFSMSALCQIAFCADMNSHLVQYEQQRHWTGQVIKSNIHQTLYWSSLPRGSGELNPNPHFWILLPCEWVPVLAPSCLIPLQSEYLFTLWQRVAEMNPKCDELLYYVNRRPTCLCVW